LKKKSSFKHMAPSYNDIEAVAEAENISHVFTRTKKGLFFSDVKGNVTHVLINTLGIKSK